ncbi:Sir2 family NAD+-dependent deacetylase [Aestuariirhabdus litorea]|uniref:NAD-dependent protein deacylase n=1 Tax=Aestuariirhabdus litorea TaxID=2528527 RepID=A0A3P3VS62_9GAMM|nr:Sir2 family NAD+-dependent deacetylase [Aestuariirhabdus litorea]RRJ84536.1 NAD-dependent protein deacylase [Aestuariirhabdus litorea]RWW97761.1 NAD-dependent protein deacylase [Endozoicomonadaceae bacterium GTF-13]
MKPFRSIVVLTGAGISAESGIRTFRATDGLWEDHRIEEVATPEGFAANPHRVQNFYNQRRQQLLSGEVHPNAAHRALADFEARFEGEFLLVTQNVDNLHERAGSRSLLHMHGELLKARCQRSGWVREQTTALDVDECCECCGEPGNLRPHIVWFNEMPLHMEQIYGALARCDLFVAIGTSGHVYPAAGFFDEARLHGAHTVELNLEPSKQASRFAEQRTGLASQLVPDFFASLR